eukprot:4960003-Heterocapsa_arctica.AAC.1
MGSLPPRTPVEALHTPGERASLHGQRSEASARPSRHGSAPAASSSGRSNFAMPGARRRDIRARTTLIKHTAAAEGTDEESNTCSICRDRFQI